MELKIIDNLKNLSVAGDGKFAKKVYESVGKYIEEKYNVEVEIKDYEDQTGTRIEFNVISRFGFHGIGEAVEFIVKYFEKRKEIEEDFEKMVAFYSEVLKEIENN